VTNNRIAETKRRAIMRLYALQCRGMHEQEKNLENVTGTKKQQTSEGLKT
jgi:hypothetical protein